MSRPDPFTAASATWRNAQRLGARSGNAFEVTGRPYSPRLLLFAGLIVAVVVLVRIVL